MSAAQRKAFKAMYDHLYMRMALQGRVSDAVKLFRRMNRLEAIMTSGFAEAKLPKARLTHLRAIVERLEGAAQNEAIEIMLYDTPLLRFFTDVVSTGEAMTSRGFQFDAATIIEGQFVPNASRAFENEAMKNLSIGMAQKQPRIFQRYLHNNHLAAQVLQYPERFIPTDLLRLMDASGSRELILMLEHNPVDVTSITDLTIWARVTLNTIAAGNPVTLRAKTPTWIPLTFDSKVCHSPDSMVGYRTNTQQFQLFAGDRLTLIDELMTELSSRSATPGEKHRFLQSFIPASAHSVFAPNDFVDIGGRVGEFYRQSFREQIKDFSAVQKDAGRLSMSAADYDLVVMSTQGYIDSHFGRGTFLNRHSKMRLRD